MIILGEPNQVVNKYVGNTKKGKRKTKIKTLFRFDKDGKYKTFDEKLIAFLIAKGFKHEQRNFEDMTYNELRKISGFNTYKMTKADIIKGLEQYGIGVDPFED